jgi:hypothetical protein
VSGLVVLLVAGLLRSHAEILRALHDLGVNLDPGVATGAVAVPSPGVRSAPVISGPPKQAQDVSGMTPRGDAVSIAVTDTRHTTLLAFLTSGCATCLDFWSAFAEQPELELPGDARLVIVTKGPEAESLAALQRIVPPIIPVVMSTETWTAYDVPVAPFFVLVDGMSGAIVGEGAASNWPQVQSLMSQALADAGMTTRRGRRSSAPGRPRGDAVREARVDRDLLAAGIVPGDPRLYRLPDSEGLPRPGDLPDLDVTGVPDVDVTVARDATESPWPD